MALLLAVRISEWSKTSGLKPSQPVWIVTMEMAGERSTKKLCKDCLFPWSRISGFKDSITNKSHIDLILFEKTRTWFFGFSEVMALNFATLPLGMTNSKLKGVPAVPMSRVCRLRRVGFLIRGKRRLYAHLHMGNVGWLSSLMIKEYEHVFLLRTKHICAHPPRFALVILELPPSHMPRDGPQQ